MEPPPLSTRPVPQLRARDVKKRSRIAIPLSSKPRDYIPGSGPPLQRLCLLPPNDSTAYIVERILLPSPGLAADRRPLPKRMTYVIGWRDLPAARLLVPAMQVLDYVSPQALEEWEWNMETELDDERKKLAEHRQKEEPAKAGKKKGRPPAHTAIESAIVADLETEAQTHPKMGTMSLSTPQKTRLEDFDEGLSDENEEASPSRQLARETGWATTRSRPDDMEVGTEDGLETNLMDAQGVGSASLEQLGAGWGSDVGKFDEAVYLSRGASSHVSTPGPSALPFRADSATQTPSGNSSRFSTIPRLFPNGRPPVLGNDGFVSLNATPNTTTRLPTSERPSSSKKAQPTTKRTKQPTPSRKPPAKRAKPKTKPIVFDDNGEPMWEVKRIEDMEIYDVDGRGIVRYFKVRWEGDWPPDQNPTWEPEDNIPANMVRNYFKRGRRKRKRASSTSTPAHKAPKMKRPALEKPALSVAKQYSSVSEAFAGDAAYDDALEVGEDDDIPRNGEEYAEDYGAGDEDGLFIVDEGQAHPVKTAWTTANGLHMSALNS
ncbi:Uncharacterized protein TPAR_01288 [Tolypocladium paradoxum]|uniref:Chromo domain-containing protein n=1 Tax=Tolypocladium paradoxum TaxID=94208 RepID=A0A2S4L7V5_9HYPO|nr:Uncharacterized protein TPAR_01288 [Tolypocladium paradoxum]